MAGAAQIGSRVAGLSVLIIFAVLVAGALYLAGGAPFTPWVNGLVGD